MLTLFALTALSSTSFNFSWNNKPTGLTWPWDFLSLNAQITFEPVKISDYVYEKLQSLNS